MFRCSFLIQHGLGSKHFGSSKINVTTRIFIFHAVIDKINKLYCGGFWNLFFDFVKIFVDIQFEQII